MLSEERYREILNRIKKNGSVTVSALSEELGVSIETIRRDLIYLEAKGSLKRVFGGAIASKNPLHFADFSARLNAHYVQKRAVAEKVSELINENDVIALDAGTTAMVVGEVLKKKFQNLTIVVYSLPLFNLLKDKFNVILTGGEYYQKEEMVYGDLAIETVKRLHTNKCFIFPSAVSISHGVEDYIPCAVTLQKELMNYSDNVFVAADSSKYDCRALMKICSIDRSHVYITDSEVGKDVVSNFERNDYTLLIGEIQNN